MKVLLTGSAGHIGRPTAALLRDRGHELRTFDRLAGGRDDPWDHHVGDLRDVLAVRRAVQGMDAVVHSGAMAGDRRSAPDEVLAVNVQGTLHVLLACAEAGVKRVVYLSSINALGSFAGHTPARRLPIDDGYEPHPATPYQLSKRLAEDSCRYATDVHGITTVCLRPVAVMGPQWYGRWRDVGPERRAEWGKGDYWSYVDVRDVSDAIALSLEAPDAGHHGFVLAARDTSMPVPTADLVRTHWPDTPWPGVTLDDFVADDPFRSLVDTAHAADVLGWRPAHSWRDA